MGITGGRVSLDYWEDDMIVVSGFGHVDVIISVPAASTAAEGRVLQLRR